MTVTLDNRQRPEPDVLVINAAAAGDLDQSTYQAYTTTGWHSPCRSTST